MNKKKVFVFGTRENSECCAHDITVNDPDVRFAGFVEDDPTCADKNGFPVLCYQEFLSSLADVNLIIPISKNRLRHNIFLRAKRDGFSLYSFISPSARVWDRDMVGENCYIQEFNNLQFGAVVADNCILWAGNHVGHHGSIGSSSQLTSHVVVSGRCRVGQFCYFGVNASVRDGISITDKVVVGMNGSVTHSLYESGLYVGCPAKRSGSYERYI